MCDPTGGVLTTALMVASTAVTAYGQYQAGQAAQDAAEYNAAVMRNNAIMEDRRAQQERVAGEAEANQRRRQLNYLIGQQRANIGASGVEASGSPLEVIADTVEQGTLDIQTIRYNAELRAQDRRFQAQNYRAQSELSLMEGRAAARAGTISAFGTILGGASSLSNPWSGGAKPFGGRLGRQTQVGSMPQSGFSGGTLGRRYGYKPGGL